MHTEMDISFVFSVSPWFVIALLPATPAQPRPTAALAFSCAAASSSRQMGGLYFSGMRINPATIAIPPAMVMAKGKPCWVMNIVERMPP